MSLILCLQCSPIDAFQALGLAKLIADIEPHHRTDVEFAVSHRRDTNPDTVNEIRVALATKFNVHVIKGKRYGTGFPVGCNDLWQETMLRLSILVRDGKTKMTGALTFEADCIPLRPDWINVLKSEWDRCLAAGKHCVGHMHGDPADHINGNAIFNIRMTKIFPEMAGAGDAGWDWWHRQLLMRVGMDTDAIFQIYRMQDVTTDKIRMIRKNGQIPALFHGTKGTSGIAAVREMIEDGTFARRTLAMDKQAFRQEVAATTDDGKNTVSVFIRSYAKDACWLEYCLRSLRRLQGATEIILAVPESDVELFRISLDLSGVRLIGVKPSAESGYICQQITKVYADEYCAGNYILYIDSDTIIPREMDVQEFFLGGCLKLLYSPWSEVGDAQCWHEPTAKILTEDPPFEFMRALPIIHHRNTLALFRRFVELAHGVSARDYIAALKRFSEFNALGAFAYLYYSERYNPIPANPEADTYPRVTQFWSWGEMNREELERLTS